MKETKQYPALGRKAKRKGPNTWRVGLLALLLLVISHCSLLTVKAQDTPFSNKFPTDLNSQDSLGRTKDNAQTTLNGSIGSSSASLTVMNGAVFPSSGFSLQIDNEILLCTTRSSNSISGCLRGQGGTSATVHASGAVVREPILTIHRDVLVNDLLTIEAKIGKGSSNASDAFSNYCLRKNGSGDTIWAPCADASSQVLSFNSRVGAVTLTAADVNALSGLTINCAACTGITGATGGVSNTGSTTIGADTDANGSGIIALQTRNLDRLRVENNGSTVLKAATGTGTGAGPSLRLTTYQNTAPIELSTLDFGFANGPPGDLDYINQTFILGYNSINGSKQVAGLVNFGLAHESKFRNGTRNVGTPGDFQTEIYYSWTDPTGAISVRPWALTIQHLTGNNAFTMQGEIYFLRQAANGGTQWGLWHENGALDLSLTTGGSITFKNNVQALNWTNAAGNNSLPVFYVDSSDRTVIGVGGGGSDVLVASNVMTTNTIRPTEIDGNGDTDTSIVFPGSNYLRFYSGGTEMMELKLGDGVNLLQNTIFTPDNTYDLGQFSFVNRRPANAYIGTSLYYGSSVRNGDVSSSVQILGTRQTGWGAPTGTATRTTFDTSSATTQDVAERLKALIDDLTTHGLIGP